MFGFSIGEVLVIVLLAVIVIGPRQLPTMMRSAGHWLAKLRRLAVDMRAQSGIDEILRQEGLEKDLRAFRAFMAVRRGNVLDALSVDLDAPEADRPLPSVLETPPGTVAADDDSPAITMESREYPIEGPDAYGAVPEDLEPYAKVSLEKHSMPSEENESTKNPSEG